MKPSISAKDGPSQTEEAENDTNAAELTALHTRIAMLDALFEAENIAAPDQPSDTDDADKGEVDRLKDRIALLESLLEAARQALPTEEPEFIFLAPNAAEQMDTEAVQDGEQILDEVIDASQRECSSNTE